jgi:hypothetical protein
MASIIEEILATLRAQDPAPLVAAKSWCIESGFEYKIASLQEEFTSSIDSLKKNFIIASRAVGDKVGDLEVLTTCLAVVEGASSPPTKKAKPDAACPGLSIQVGILEAQMSTNAIVAAFDTNNNMKVRDERAANIVDQFETRFNDLEAKLGQLVAKGNKRAIGFAGLGFLKPAQANTWIKAEMPSHPAGLIVDIHVVLERIHHSMSNISTLHVMQQLVKIKVQSIANGSAITLYDQKIPKCFSKSSGHRVIWDEALFLDLIPAWKD